LRESQVLSMKSFSNRAMDACATIALLALVLVVPATVGASQSDQPPRVEVRLNGYVLTPALDGDGAPQRDETGAPVILRVPLADGVVTPGDPVLYVVQLANRTDSSADHLVLTADLAAELQLDPFSILGPAGLDVAWTDDPEQGDFRPLFDEIDGERTMVANLDTLRALRLTLPALAPGRDVSVEYTTTLR
jgi:hypothetical protein